MRIYLVKAAIIVGTLAVCLLIGYVSVMYLKSYGWLVFFVIPFLMGFLPSYIVNRWKHLSKEESDTLSFLNLSLSFFCLGLACVGLLVFAIEGAICIAMASPLIILVVWFGSLIGRLAGTRYKVPPGGTSALLLFCTLAAAVVDAGSGVPDLIPVRTSVVVKAPIEQVWTNVISFSEIPPPEDWIFKTGISYPVNATIDGQGVGAIRYCNFSTGSFVEPITAWEEPTLLQFSVKEQPIPMSELNPFWDVHPPHLDGYFQSHKGQFKLTAISERETLLEGTTWYTVNIQPEFYWSLWSDFIVHRIHQRVLDHIKVESEE